MLHLANYHCCSIKHGIKYWLIQHFCAPLEPGWMSTCLHLELYVIFWLVVWNIFLFFHILGTIIPTDSNIFQRYTTNQYLIWCHLTVESTVPHQPMSWRRHSRCKRRNCKLWRQAMEGSSRIFSTANPEWFMVPSGYD